MKKPELKLGMYKHYKGDLYEVLDLVLHTETNEWMVLYKAHSYDFEDEHGLEILFVRPYVMFIEQVTYKEKSLQRFTYIN